MKDIEKKDKATVSQVLYRKYRPHTFADVIGQDHVVKALEGAVKNKTITHAYLFAGSRGTGKTSVARIFSRALGVSPYDTYEIDAASHTQVEKIRELTDSVSALPLESPYKVYILDEVHMLSKASFNALLKTLEEPPAHAIFILATTEVYRLPDTVVSRCQTFTFKKPSLDTLKKVVMSVAKDEGFSIALESADLIALLGDGSFRDTLGTLQKVLGASKDKKIEPDEVLVVTGAPKESLVNDCITGLHKGLASEALLAIRATASAGADMEVFLKLLIRKVRYVLLLRFAPDLAKELSEELTPTEAKLLSGFAGEKGSRINASALLALLEAESTIGRSAIPSLPLEIAVIKICGEDKSAV